jgi:hypothetical protein
MMRAGHFLVAFLAALALVIGSTFFAGWRFWLFSAAVIGGAAWAIFRLYVRASRRWLAESYRLLGEAKLSQLKPRVEEELRKNVSGVNRQIVELLWAEVLFWSGEFEAAYTAATAIDLERLPALWRAAVHGVRFTSSLFGGQLERAKEILTTNHEALTKRPGLHHLEALVLLREGDAKAARERFRSRVETLERPPLVRAALALVEAEIAQALGEDPTAKLEEAHRLGGESWVAEKRGQAAFSGVRP